MTSSDPTREREAAQILSRAWWRIRRTVAEPERAGVGERGPSTISTHPLSILPARGRGDSCPEVSTRDPRESYLAPGKVRQGVRTCGLKPQDTSPLTVRCLRPSGHMIGAAVSSSSAKADSLAAE